MPYEVFEVGSQWCVYKVTATGRRTGDSLGCHATRGDAGQQVQALYANEETMTETTEKAGRVLSAANKNQMMEALRGLWRLLTGAGEDSLDLYEAMETDKAVQVVKSSDPLRYMFIYTSNGYVDRDGETITTEALKQAADDKWYASDRYRGDPVLLWHKEGAQVGTTVWGEVIDGFLVELVQEAPTLLGKAVFDYVEAHPAEMGASHGFKFRESDKDADGVYHRIDKFETSVLPRRFAANALTKSEVLKTMDAERAKALDEILKIEGAAKLLETGGVSAINEALAKRGVTRKEEGAEIEVSAPAPASPTEFATMMAQLLEAISAQHTQMGEMAKKMNDMKMAYDEMSSKAGAMDGEVKALKAQLEARPRASIAPETTVDAKTLEAVKSQLPVETVMFGGLRVPKS